MIIWNREVKACQVVEFRCFADVKKVSEKENIYRPRSSKSHGSVSIIFSQ